MKRPKNYGGLGIQGMIEKNLIMLAKWWWKLTNSNEGLWRELILDKYKFLRNAKPNSKVLLNGRMSKEWQDIIKVSQNNDEVGKAFRDGIKLKLGRGELFRFWNDVWIGETSLKDKFPKLFDLAMKKESTINEMGFWEGGKWYWDLKFRRQLYQWEEEEKRTLIIYLDHVEPKEEEDQIIWTYTTEGTFSTNSLMKAAIELVKKEKKWEPMTFKVWSGLAPPKVELLIWRIYHDSLPTKELLVRRGILTEDEDADRCALCGEELVSIAHILIHCRWSREIWCLCLRW